MLFSPKKITKTALSVLLLSLIISLLASCVFVPEIGTKEQILTSVESEESTPRRNYSYVSDYLRYFGIPSFDVAKVKWAERVFFTYYNYDHGTGLSFDYARGDVLPLAVAVARCFVEDYYDTTELSSKEAVTEALIGSYIKVSADPYAVYRTPAARDEFETDMSGTYSDIGAVFEYRYDEDTLTVIKVNPSSPAELAGVKVGDLVHAIDGELLSDIGFLNLISKIQGEVGTSLTLTVLREGEQIDLVVTRVQIIEKSVKYELLEDGIGYISISSFKDNTDEQFAAAIEALADEGAVGLVLDLRNNFGGYVGTALNMLSYLLPSGKTLFSYQYKGGVTRSILSSDDPRPNGETFDSVVDLPISVITNAHTASAAEIFAAAIRDYIASGELSGVSVGTKTYGKGVVQNSISYSDGSSITLTVTYCIPPSSVSYHGVGIVPDVIDQNPSTQLITALSEIKKLTACSVTQREHVFGDYVSNNNASCTSDSTQSAKCIYCSVTDTKIEPATMLSHEYGEYTSNGDVTFTKDGTKSARCVHCNSVDTVVDVGSHEGKLDLINAAISESLSVGKDTCQSVSAFLISWGFPSFNQAKLRWAEDTFKSHYNLNHGTDLSFDYKAGDVLPLSVAVARRFLSEYLPYTDTDDTEAMTNALIDAYVYMSADKYSVYRLAEDSSNHESDMSGNYSGIGALIEYDHLNETVMILTVLDGSAADIAGLLVGDYIYAINGETVEEIGYINVTKKIRGETGTTVEITVLRDGELITVSAIRAPVVEESVSYKMLENGIVYVKISTFNANTDEQFCELINEIMKYNPKGIIFDLRHNTGGYISSVTNALSYILPSDKLLLTYQYKSGLLRSVASGDDSRGVGEPYDSVVDVPMIVLADSYTASAGEIFVSVIRDYRDKGELCALIIGEKTYGKGVIQNSFTYSDGSTITLTTAYYNTPSGINYHGIGITPDIQIEKSDDGDTQLDIAIYELEMLINSN